MNDADLPRILIVDDGETSSHVAGIDTQASTRGRHPNEIDVTDLDWADLVLMDFKISDWRAREELDPVSLRPMNGLALAAVLREHVDANNGDCHSYTAFAIHSAHIGDISKRLHTTNQTPYVVARLNNLEWVFDKADRSRFARSVELACAVRTISESWNSIKGGGVSMAAAELLRLPQKAKWTQRALDDVVLCQLPLSKFSAGTNGLLFLRWMLHGVLPYPTFLWAHHWVAARLRISPASLLGTLKNDSALAGDLNALSYDGVLKSFWGQRWWRAGIEQYAWSIRAAGARGPKEFHAELEKRAGGKLSPVADVSPVVCVDRELNRLDELRPLQTVVRLVPDLWPAYADAAYAEIDVVQGDGELAAIVHPLDRGQVVTADEED